ncbi:hypothetical protein [Nitratireductor luteus]|uniref:hypothetical protein n=1 Tax=Nitratireductor luteus TaxID=2976980 RepID=UPI0022409B11|nr:hypothetical protein [Nitratireductor luteus]
MNIPEWTKPAIFGAAGGAFALAILGFTWGGWVTGGTAEGIAAHAAQDAREQIVASICVERFIASADAASDQADLKEASSWQRDNLIEEAGWITLTALPDNEQVAGAADICAERLVAMEDLPERMVMPEASVVDPKDVDAEPSAIDG